MTREYFAGMTSGAAVQQFILAAYASPPVSLEAGLIGCGFTLAALFLLWLSGRGRAVKLQDNICVTEDTAPTVRVGNDNSVYVYHTIRVALSEQPTLKSAALALGGRLSRRSLAKFSGISEESICYSS